MDEQDEHKMSPHKDGDKISHYMDTNLILPTVGFREEQPLKCAGILRLPPISDPIPSMAPPAPINAPSPPDDPPGVLVWSWGFTVVPKIGLEHS